MKLTYRHKKTGMIIDHEDLIALNKDKFTNESIQYVRLGKATGEQFETYKYKVTEIPFSDEFEVCIKDELTYGDYCRMIHITRASALCDSYTLESLEIMKERAMEIGKNGIIKLK